MKCLLFPLSKKYAIDQNSEVLLQTGVMKTKMMPVISIVNVCQNHAVNFSGLILNPDFLHHGASPDGIVNCSCCGVGCFEIKCPSKYRDNLIEDMIFGSYLEFGNGGAVEIIKLHAYYQIQIQLLVTQYDYCDFFMLVNDFVFIRIEPDKELFEKISRKCTFL